MTNEFKKMWEETVTQYKDAKEKGGLVGYLMYVALWAFLFLGIASLFCYAAFKLITAAF